jgi:hypothetical protein
LFRDCIIQGSKNKFINPLKYYIYIPSNFKLYCLFSVTKLTYVIQLYSLKYYFTIPIFFKNVFLNFDIYTNSLILTTNMAKIKFFSWIKDVSNLLFLFTSFFLKKIKFRGKGYYLYKNYRNTITPQFGYSHRIYFYSYFIRGIFLTKTKVIFFGFNKYDVLHTPLTIRSKRFINVFTGRGVRFSDQVIYKKSGKISLYR